MTQNKDPKSVPISPNTIQVDELPFPIENGANFRINSENTGHGYTHSLFTYPAKLHVPVVKWAISHFANDPTIILDPYNGSGTVQVEARLSGHNSIGLDVDTVANFIAQAKVHPINPEHLRTIWERLGRQFEVAQRPRTEYLERQTPSNDIDLATYENQIEGFWIPEIPNIFHWFRKYVLVDLAKIRQIIQLETMTDTERRFFMCVFAAIIRRCSNADPVPVSGLEYTKHMKERDAKGRVVDPFSAYRLKVSKEIDGMAELWEHTQREGVYASVLPCSSLNLGQCLPDDANGNVGLVVTSPPYCNAVEYHSRHKLEAYWLDLVDDYADYAGRYHDYIGRRRIRRDDVPQILDVGITELNAVLAEIEVVNSKKVESLRKYFSDIEVSLRELHHVMAVGAKLCVVIGNSTCYGHEIQTARFLNELALRYFLPVVNFSYDVINHSMTYPRRNGAHIQTEWCYVYVKAPPEPIQT